MEVKIIADGEKFSMKKVKRVVLVLEKGEFFDEFLISEDMEREGGIFRIPGWLTLQGYPYIEPKVEEPVYHKSISDDFIPYEDPLDE